MKLLKKYLEPEVDNPFSKSVCCLTLNLYYNIIYFVLFYKILDLQKHINVTVPSAVSKIMKNYCNNMTKTVFGVNGEHHSVIGMTNDFIV